MIGGLFLAVPIGATGTLNARLRPSKYSSSFLERLFDQRRGRVVAPPQNLGGKPHADDGAVGFREADIAE